MNTWNVIRLLKRFSGFIIIHLSRLHNFHMSVYYRSVVMVYEFMHNCNYGLAQIYIYYAPLPFLSFNVYRHLNNMLFYENGRLERETLTDTFGTGFIIIHMYAALIVVVAAT